MKKTLKEYYPQLTDEWIYEKNEIYGRTPENTTYGSEYKAWWKCPICNNEYQTAVKNRTRGSNCPRCCNNNGTSFPEQAIYYYLNKEFEDTQNRWNTIGTELDIFIPSLCLGIEYDGSFYHNSKESNEREQRKFKEFNELGIKIIRVREKGLNQESYAHHTICINDSRKDKYIEDMIIKIFDYIESNYNLGLKIDIDLKRDRQEIYKQYIYQRKENSILKLFPEQIKDWNYDKNSISPESITPGSEKKVWWICPLGHSYNTQIYTRVKLNTGCPICNGKQVLKGYNDFESQQPNLLKEWNYKKNEELGINPSDIHMHSWKNVWWICSKCGYEWKATPGRRSEGSGCRICANNRHKKIKY